MRDVASSQRCGGAAALAAGIAGADYVGGVHPRFDRAKAEGFLAKTTIKRTSRVRELSKGMVAHTAPGLVMRLTEAAGPRRGRTLGLDILYRKQFYDSLLNDYFDRSERLW